MYTLKYRFVFKVAFCSDFMLEVRGNEKPVDRYVIVPVLSSTERKAEYVVPKGSSGAIQDIRVSYQYVGEEANGDIYRERETVDLSFAYPKGRTNKHFTFEVYSRDYNAVHKSQRDEEDVPVDVLEVLVDALPLEVRRLLPSLPRKK